MRPISSFSTGVLLDSPLGNIWVATSEQGLAAIEWSSGESAFTDYLIRRFKRPVQPGLEKVSLALQQLDEYLHGARTNFELSIDWSLLRPFQQEVLRITCAIPYGETRTYGEIAREMGKPRAARAVGRAQATNPMPLVIPCHRVIGADGKLHGYGAGQGLLTKEWLLRMEGTIIA